MRWLLVIAMLGTSAAADPLDLGPFRGGDDQLASASMDEMTHPCRELVKRISDQGKVSCGLVGSLKVGARLAEVYRAESAFGFETQMIAEVLVIHDGTKLLASPVITASAYSKLGAYSSLERSLARLHAVGGAIVLELTTWNIWHEQRTTPSEATPWQAHAFMACRITGDVATCSFVAVGEYMDPCSAAKLGTAGIHYTCTSGEGDIAIPVLHD